MRKFLMGLIVALIAIALSAGSMPANASSGDSVTVESISYAETSSKANVTAESRAVIDGATQLTWEEPNHSVAVTSKQLKKAVQIKVNATGANSSKVVYKKAKAKLFKKYKKTMPKGKAKKKAVKGSRIVILKAGSCVRNRGKLNKLRRGFVWCPDAPVVFKYDGKSDQYRHSHTLLTASGLEALKQELASQGRLDELEVVGTVVRGGVTYFIVKWCLNYIGGDVIMLVKVIQVRFEHNLLIDVELESHVDVSATVKASLVCPSGTLYGEASASASGYAAASIRVKMKDKDASVEAEKSRILAEARAAAKTKAQALAQAKVVLECGSTPPPPPPVTPKPDLIEIDTINDVLVNNSRTITVSGNTAPDHSGSLFCTARNGGSITAGKQQTVSGSFSKQITYLAPSEVPGPNAEYNISAGRDRVDCTLTQDDGQKDDISTNQFEIRPAPVDPL